LPQCRNENQVELTKLETELDQLLLRGVQSIFTGTLFSPSTCG